MPIFLSLFFLLQYIHARRRWDCAIFEPEIFRILGGLTVLCALWAIILPWKDQFLLFRLCHLLGMFGAVTLLIFSLWLELFPAFMPKAAGDEPLLLVLGAPVCGGRPTPNLTSRAACTADWLKKYPNARAILSGGRSEPTEAAAMAAIITEHGISPTRLIPEEQSTTTDENFRFSSDWMTAHGYTTDTPLVIVTNRFHLFRLRYYAANSGLTSLRYHTTPTPLSEAFLWNFREMICVVRYWVLGK